MRRLAGLALLTLLNSTSVAVAQEPGWWQGFSAHGFYGTLWSANVLEGELYAVGPMYSNGSVRLGPVSKWGAQGWRVPSDHPGFDNRPFFNSLSFGMYEGGLVGGGLHAIWHPPGPFRWNGSSWELMAEGLWADHLYLFSSTTFEGELILGGIFGGIIGGADSPSIASWNGTEWNPLGGGVSGIPYSMLPYKGSLYVAGDFRLIDDGTIQALACWDGSFWAAVSALDPAGLGIETGLLPSPGQSKPIVYSLAIHEDKLAIGGAFSGVGSVPAVNVVLLDATMQDPRWEIPNLPQGTGDVRALGSFDGDLYGGGYPEMIPDAIEAGSLGIIEGDGWTHIPDAPDGPVLSLATYEEALHVAGNFHRAGGLACSQWVKWTGTRFEPHQNPAGLGVSGRVYDLAQFGNQMLVVGSFQNAGYVHAGGLALWDGSAWEGFAGGDTPGEVRDVLVDAGDVYAVGEFDEMGGIAAGNVARFDGTSWQGYPEPPGSEGHGLSAVAVWRGDLYVAADDLINDDGFIQRWSGSGWEHVAWRDVKSMVAYGDQLLMGGRWSGFSVYDGATFTRPLLPPPGSGDVDWCGDIVIRDGLAWLAARIPAIGGGNHAVATWDGDQLQGYGPPRTLDQYSVLVEMDEPRPLDLAFADGIAYFTDTGEETRGTVWSWDGVSGHWDHVAAGVRGDPFAALVFDEELYVGGAFGFAGYDANPGADPWSTAVASSGIARFVANPLVGTDPAPRSMALSLHQNTPNPFNPSTTIDCVLPADGGDISLEIFDARGRRVRSLWNGPHVGGDARFIWDGNDEAGRSVASGNYMCLLSTNGEHVSRKMVLVR